LKIQISEAEETGREEKKKAFLCGMKPNKSANRANKNLLTVHILGYQIYCHYCGKFDLNTNELLVAGLPVTGDAVYNGVVFYGSA